MKPTENKPVVLPALRGIMGDWVYYSCLMDLKRLATAVEFAREIHKSEQFSDMIQRELTEKRATQIADYLATQPERLFNSLVIATYGGQPNWHPLSEVKSKSQSEELRGLNKEIVESVGFLTLRGDEKLFAVDGQHRLAGIKKAVGDGLDQDPYDEVPVIFVAHKNDNKGMERTRRLFTTLNKTARPVSKGDIIALDEDDVMALSVRWLIEEDKDLFGGGRIAFVPTNNMPVTNFTSLTTIGNLYDILAILFSDAQTELKKPRSALQAARPDDDKLREYYIMAKKMFLNMKDNFPELDEFFTSDYTEPVVRRYRGQHGGSALFRPIGLEIFTRIIARLTADMCLSEAVYEAARLPTNLTLHPFRGLMWDVNNRKISNAHKVTVRELLLYMLCKTKFSEDELLQRYRKESGDETLKLPSPVI